MSILRRVVLVQLVLFCRIAVGQEPVRYIISLADIERHLVHVTLEIPPGSNTHELQLPVWNALYQVRDFSQFMNWIRAEDTAGQSLDLKQLNKSRWLLGGAANGARVQYEIFSDDSSPFGSQLNQEHAFFNLAEVLLYAEDDRQDAMTVEFRNLPQGWKIATPLARNQGRNEEIYAAKNYDELVDSPVEIGTFGESDFRATCGNYRVIVDSADAAAILDKILPPLQSIVSAATSWMNDCPFQSYMFIYHFSESPGGGMEHAYGTAITMRAKSLTGSLEEFTSVTAHEFFHLWNVKRIRPQSLEPIDYTKENYTPALWFSEGVDTTVSDSIRLRAGLLDEQHYLDQLGQAITELESRPAHLTQSAEQSSIDAWLEKYSYFGLPQRSISYYNKGELLGVLLDLRMRDESRDQASLQTLFRWMNEHYAKTGKFFADSEGVRQAAETLGHADLRDLFANYVSGVREIPWDDFFAGVGLRVTRSDAELADRGFDAVQKFDQPPTVVRVQPGSEAKRAGLKPDDVIAQVNGRATGRDFEKDIEALGPGGLIHLTVRRQGVQHQLQWKLGSRKQTVFQLHDVPEITPQQRARRAAWLFGDGDKHQQP